MKKSDSFYDKIYRIVKRVPKGKVATYGQIAAICGAPRSARTVGWALHVLPADKLEKVPWHRVINREGRISTTCLEHPADMQAYLLKTEGIEVIKKEGNWRINLEKYLWKI